MIFDLSNIRASDVLPARLRGCESDVELHELGESYNARRCTGPQIVDFASPIAFGSANKCLDDIEDMDEIASLVSVSRNDDRLTLTLGLQESADQPVPGIGSWAVTVENAETNGRQVVETMPMRGQLLGKEFAQPVRIDGRERMVFAGRPFGETVNRGGGGIDNLRAAVPSCAVEDSRKTRYVGSDIVLRKIERRTMIGDACAMDDCVKTIKNLAFRVDVEQVAVHDSNAVVVAETRKPLNTCVIGDIQGAHEKAAINESFDRMEPQESGSAGHQDARHSFAHLGFLHLPLLKPVLSGPRREGIEAGLNQISLPAQRCKRRACAGIDGLRR